MSAVPNVGGPSDTRIAGYARMGLSELQVELREIENTLTDAAIDAQFEKAIAAIDREFQRRGPGRTAIA